MNQEINKKGFTIIELMLAMTFVSFLLLAVAMTIIQIANVYNRGTTLKEVNQAGSAIETELKRAISNTQPFDISSRYVENSRGGRLCTGQYSFVWNYGSNLSSGPGSRNRYSDTAEPVVKFIKVSDPGASYCSTNNTVINNIDFSKSTELLDIGEHNLALHDFSINEYSSAQDGATGQRLYSFRFILGTNDRNAITGTSCKTPDQSGADAVYCYINQFDFTVRSGSNEN